MFDHIDVTSTHDVRHEKIDLKVFVVVIPNIINIIDIDDTPPMSQMGNQNEYSMWVLHDLSTLNQSTSGNGVKESI